MTDTQRPARPSTTKRAPKTAATQGTAPKRARATKPAPVTAKAAVKRKPAASKKGAPRRPVDFSYEPDAPRRPAAPTKPVDAGAVRANGDIHLALADEAWWIMPQVCAKTAEPARKTITYAPSGAPKWAYLSFLLGVIPGVLVLRAAFKSARVQVPFANGVRRRRSLFMAAFIFCFAIGLPMLIGGAATATAGTAIAGAVLIALAVVAALRARTGVKVRIAGDDVVISGAHPAFAAAFSMQATPNEQRSVFENTSGAGKAAFVPLQIKRWNWGAFFFGGIWAIGNSVWVGLLGFVPVVNIVMAFMLAIKGNEWAWRKKRWPSVENFMQTQKHWAGAAAALLAGTIVLTTIYSIAAYEAPPAAAPGVVTDATVEGYADGSGGVSAGSEYGFTATFPTTPRHETTTEQVDGTALDIDVLSSEFDDAAFQVGVVTYDFPGPIVDTRGFFRAVANGNASGLGGKVDRMTETTVFGDPAAGVSITGANGVYARQRYVLHGMTLYTIQVVATTPNPSGFGRFVGSFRVVDAPPAR